jgi:DNA-binding GntR family transcriptional regulator
VTDAYEQIRSAIVESRYKAGERLVEQRIAAEFEFSRTPVREALRRLEAEGLVVSERNRGAVVRPLALDDVVDLYELRARLESYAAELAAARRSPSELTSIGNAVAAFSDALDETDADDLDTVRAMNAANGLVHGAIVAAAHHERLAAMLARTVDIPLVFQAFRRFDRDERKRSDLFHQLIYEAIVGSDGPRAGRLMTEHILQGLAVLRAAMPGADRGPASG